jgi:hypothetical protein
MYRSSQAAGYLSSVKMQLTGPFIPKSLTHVHVHVEIEGSLHMKTYEADPNLSHTFAWSKRNVYKQKVYGVAQARISIGYDYSSCASVIWETQTATLQGYDVDISDVGGWGLDIHHHYNFHEGILQKGDGSTLHFKQYPRKVNVVMGTGQRRDLIGQNLDGLAKDARLLTPVALTSGPDGSIYVGDFDLVRRITPEGDVYTVLILRYARASPNSLVPNFWDRPAPPRAAPQIPARSSLDARRLSLGMGAAATFKLVFSFTSRLFAGAGARLQ